MLKCTTTMFAQNTQMNYKLSFNFSFKFDFTLNDQYSSTFVCFMRNDKHRYCLFA